MQIAKLNITKLVDFVVLVYTSAEFRINFSVFSKTIFTIVVRKFDDIRDSYKKSLSVFKNNVVYKSQINKSINSP